MIYATWLWNSMKVALDIQQVTGISTILKMWENNEYE